MKRSKIFYITLVQIFLALFFSCKNTADYKDTAAKIRFSLSCRTIEPNPQSEDMTDFVLKARQSSTTDTYETIASYSNYEALQNAELEMQAGTYDFILTSKIGGSSFEGKLENHTIVNGNNILSFAVSFVSTGSTGSTGSVSVSFTLPQNAGVGSVKAWLENRETGAAVTGSQKQSELSDNHYVYSVSNIPVGDWRLMVTFYCDNEYRNKNYIYPELVHVAADIESTKAITLNELNPSYTITYVLNGGDWVNGFTPTHSYTRHGAELPTSSNIMNGWRQFEAWYTTSTFEEGTEITSISGTNPADITVYAKWYNGNVITANQLSSFDLSNETGTYYLTFKGASANNLTALASIIRAIPENGAKVWLSVESSPTLTTINNTTFKDCKNLEAITIPASVETIGNFVFDNCTGLKKITFEDGSEDLSIGYNNVNSNGTGQGLFYECPIEELYIGRNLIGSVFSKDRGYSPFALNSSTNMAVTIGETVTVIKTNLFYNSSGVTSVTIDDDAEIISINSSAFYGCSNLTSLTIPDTVTSIGNSVFYGCTKLGAITIPASVNSIGDYAFDNCTGLKVVTIEDGSSDLTLGYNNYNSSGTGQGLFYDCPIEELYIGRNISWTVSNGYSSRGYSPFALNPSEGIAVTIGPNITTIPAYLFYNSSGINSVSISTNATIESIGQYSFYNCSKLESFTVPEDVTSIGNSAFCGCTKLGAITIPVNVTNIGNYAFDNCTSLKVVNIEDGTTGLTLGYNNYTSSGIGQGLFYDCPIEELYIGRNISLTYTSNFSYYGYSPFAQNPSTGMEVTIGENVTAISAYMFYNSSGVTSVTIDEDAVIATIDNYAFFNCSKLTSFTIPDDVWRIGTNAFSGCSKLGAITIPASVEKINNSAFDNCSELKVVTIVDANQSLELGYNNYTSSGIGQGLFYDCPIEELYIGRNISVTYTSSYSYYGYSPFALNSSTDMTVTIGANVTYILSYLFYNSSGVTSVSIAADSGINSICKSAFFNCSKIESFIIPENVIKIESYAFSGCSSLSAIIIPEEVKNINDGAFDNCTGLKNITIEDGPLTLNLGYNNYNSSGTGQGLFYDCPIEELYIGRNLSWISSNGYSHYGYSPFACIEATTSSPNMSVTISRQVTKGIPAYLFYNTTKINSISFTGRTTGWDILTKGNNWNYGINTTTVICSNGEVDLQ